MRAPRGITPAAAAAALALLAGCGTKFDLPTETPGGNAVPSDGSYQMVATWGGMSDVRDLLFSSSSQVYVLFQRADGAYPRGEVRVYPRSRPTETPVPLAGYPFAGLMNPVALAQGGSSVFVLDQGDSCRARRNPVSGSCADGSHDVSFLEDHWQLREYNLVGGSIGAFTDTTVAWVSGVAADPQGRVYVSGYVLVRIQDPFDDRLFTRQYQSQVVRFARGPKYPGIPDPNVIGGDWHRDTTWKVVQGSGRGSVEDPRGIYWSAATGAGGLYVVEHDKNWAQKLYDDVANEGYYFLDGGGSGTPFLQPEDITLDAAGNVYVVDTGNRRVVRFRAGGDSAPDYEQRVDLEPDADGMATVQPVAVAVDSENDVVLVADRGLGKVIRYKKRP